MGLRIDYLRFSIDYFSGSRGTVTYSLLALSGLPPGFGTSAAIPLISASPRASNLFCIS